MVEIKHTATAPLPDEGLIGADEWNANHTVTVSASPRVLGRTTSGAGAAEELTAGTGISFTTGQVVNTAPHIATNLGITGTGDTRTITSSTGTDVTVPVATTTTAGWLSAGDKTKLDGIAPIGTVEIHPADENRAGYLDLDGMEYALSAYPELAAAHLNWRAVFPDTVSGTPTLADVGFGAAFSPDGSFLAVGHGNSPFLTVINTSDWSVVTGTPTLANVGWGAAFSPDGAFLAVAHEGSPFLTVIIVQDPDTLRLPAPPAPIFLTKYTVKAEDV